MTQSEAKPSTTFRQPPLRLEVSMGRVTKELCRVDVHVYNGKYCLLHRSVVTNYDPMGDLPLSIENALYRWVAWLCGEQLRQRQPEGSQRNRRREPLPPWPSSIDIDTLMVSLESHGEGAGT